MEPLVKSIKVSLALCLGDICAFYRYQRQDQWRRGDQTCKCISILEAGFLLEFKFQFGSPSFVLQEPVKTKFPQLLYETKIYKILNGGSKFLIWSADHSLLAGIPTIHWFGVEGDYNAMVMDLLGPSLEDLFNYCKRKLTIKTVLMIAD